MYSVYNEGKSVVAERFIRTLKNKLYEHMTAGRKNVYYDVLDDVVNKYNNTKHSAIKMKPIDVTNNNKRVYIDGHNEKDRYLNLHTFNSLCLVPDIPPAGKKKFKIETDII